MSKIKYRVFSSVKHFVIDDNGSALAGENRVLCMCDTVESADIIAEAMNLHSEAKRLSAIGTLSLQLVGRAVRIPISSHREVKADPFTLTKCFGCDKVMSSCSCEQWDTSSVPPAKLDVAVACVRCGSAIDDCLCWLDDLPLTPAQPEPVPITLGKPDVHCSDCNMSVYRCKCMPLETPPIGPGLPGSSTCIAGNGQGACMCIVCDCPF